MTGDERTCAEELQDAYLSGYSDLYGCLKVIHPDLPDMPAATLRRYITLGQWVDDPTNDGDDDVAFLRSIGAEPA